MPARFVDVRRSKGYGRGFGRLAVTFAWPFEDIKRAGPFLNSTADYYYIRLNATGIPRMSMRTAPSSFSHTFLDLSFVKYRV